MTRTRRFRSWLALVAAAGAALLVVLPTPVTPTRPASAAPCPCSIWASTATPTTPSDPDTAAVEVGTKFRSDVDGYVTAVRFYKGAGNTGTHVGHLWTAAGASLGTVTFSGETATGWQQAPFASPVPITAGTTYVVSYYAPNGRYAADAGYFAGQGVDSAPLHALRDGASGSNGVYRYGTGGGFPTNSWQSANYWVDVVFGTAVTDTVAPAVTSTSPGNGVTGVPATTTVSAVLSEPIQAGTVALGLVRGGGTVVAGSTAYDPQSRTVTFTPDTALAPATAYTATVSGATDPSGNTMASHSWSFTTTPAGQDCPCTIWPDSAVPAVTSVQDNSAVEVGVRFRTSAGGYVTGLRFYKGAGNTGTHVGSLWTSTGTRLSSVTFTGETATGWQSATLPAPVPVAANTTYVASYHTGAGFYSATNGGLAAAVSRGPLTALANGVDGGNGVYLYGGGGFPTNTFQATNYWVDVVFNTTATDTVPPAVTLRVPAPGAPAVPATTSVSATFSEPVVPSTVVTTLTGPAGAVPGTVAYDAATNTSTFTPDTALAHSTAYTAAVSGARDLAGNTMSPASWSFTTAAPPPPSPDQGPGGPILVIRNSSTSAGQFSPFLAEILRTEGLNEFATADLSTVTATALSQYDVVLLGSTPLTAAQVSMFTAWVTGGGNLVAFRPDRQLATLLGLTAATGTLSEGYVKVDAATAPGAGITDQTIQFHGVADRYLLSGARAVATLYATPTSPTVNPAVSLVNVGTSGGQAAAFTYDLPRSIVYTRQGNPAWEQQERDGFAPIRSDDLYFGGGGGGGADWVNLDKVAIPQADEQQRLLANLIGAMNADRKPLPRFWYFPRGANAVVVATGDDHGNGGTAGRFDQYTANSPDGCEAADWECLGFTSYVYPNTPLSNAQATSYHGAGFELGLHAQNGCVDYTPTSLADGYATQLSQWVQRYPGLPAPETNRYHCIVWSDWSSQPTVEASNGMRLDTNYYYWPGSWIADRPGFMTGSGMPMRFTDKTGTFINVYQAPTQMTDESGQSYPFTPNSLLDAATGPLGYYGAFVANMHTDNATLFQSDQLLVSAAAHGVPVVSARQLLTWLNGRNSSSYSGISWAANTLSFTVNAGVGANGLMGMVPTIGQGGKVLATLARQGSPVPITRTTVKGVEYAMFPAAAGSYTATYGSLPPPPPRAPGAGSAAGSAAGSGAVTTAVPDRIGPRISDVTVRPLPDGTAVARWRTDENTDAKLLVGPRPDALVEMYDDEADDIHTAVVTRLLPATTYHYRVKSTDAAGNATVWPAPADPPATFVSAASGVADLTVPQFRTTKGEAGTYVQQDDLGEVSLAPAAAEEFATATLPPGWDEDTKKPGGWTACRRGNLVLDGRSVATKATVGPGRSLVFRATFAGSGTQWVGLAPGRSEEPRAMFVLSDRTLYAGLRTDKLVTVPLPARLIGTAHVYRIDWTGTGYAYSVDGQPVAALAATGGPMRLRAGDIETDRVPLVVDWLRVPGNAGAGHRVSRILDAHQMVTWDRLTYQADIPAGTAVRIKVRTGSTRTPDASWSAWTAVGPGGRVDASSRYLQYRIELSSAKTGSTPVVRDVAVTHNGIVFNPPGES